MDDDVLYSLDEGVAALTDAVIASSKLLDKTVDEIGDFYVAMKNDEEADDDDEGAWDDAEEEIDDLIDDFNDKLDDTLEAARRKIDEQLGIADKDDGDAEYGEDGAAADITMDAVTDALDVFSATMSSCLSMVDDFVSKFMDIVQMAANNDFAERGEIGQQVAEHTKECLGGFKNTMQGVVNDGLDALRGAIKTFDDDDAAFDA